MFPFPRLFRRPAPAGLSPLATVPRGSLRLPSGKKVRVRAFQLDIRPVTNGDWVRFMQATGAAAPPWLFRPGWDDPEQPVVGITHQEALAFARWARKRLPTEAEYQRALGPHTYPWGDSAPTPKHAHFGAPATARTLKPSTPQAGLRSAGDGPFGHHDLVGNVWERLAEGVARGGFWGSEDPLSSLRITLKPEERSAGVGFRCCR